MDTFDNYMKEVFDFFEDIKNRYQAIPIIVDLPTGDTEIIPMDGYKYRSLRTYETLEKSNATPVYVTVEDYYKLYNQLKNAEKRIEQLQTVCIVRSQKIEELRQEKE